MYFRSTKYNRIFSNKFDITSETANGLRLDASEEKNMTCSGYDHESNDRMKRIKLDPLVNIRNESVFFKYSNFEIDLVDND
jgi:hypothetical protein